MNMFLALGISDELNVCLLMIRGRSVTESEVLNIINAFLRLKINLQTLMNIQAFMDNYIYGLSTGGACAPHNGLWKRVGEAYHVTDPLPQPPFCCQPPTFRTTNR